MKTFRYHHSVAVWVLLAIVVGACGTGAVINFINALNNLDNTFKLISHIIMGAITLIFTIFALSAMIGSKYVIKKDKVYLYFGLFGSSTPIADATDVTFIPARKRLVLVFTYKRFLAIVISPELFDEFVKEIRTVNQSIVYHVDNTGMEDETV